MVVERAVCVGFNPDFVFFKRSRHLKTPTKLAIGNEFPFNPTYDCLYRARFFLTV